MYPLQCERNVAPGQPARDRLQVPGGLTGADGGTADSARMSSNPTSAMLLVRGSMRCGERA